MADFVRLAAALLVLPLMAGCSAVTGDFGRAEPGPFSNDVLPAARAKVSADGKTSVAAIVLTDTERQMRDRIYRFLNAPHSYDWFADAARLLQAAGHKGQMPQADRYYVWLHGSDFASTAARYNRLRADISDDQATLPDTFVAICAVEKLDRQRGLAANQLDLEASLNAGAAARQAENKDLTARFVAGLENRYDSYSYALDHLLVEAPDPAAQTVDAQLSALATALGTAKSGDFCIDAPNARQDGPLVLDDGTEDGAPRSRFSMSGGAG